MPFDRDTVLSWLIASCDLQGVPVVVSDAGIVGRVGVLLGGRGAAGASRSGDRSARRSAAPAGNDSARIDRPGAGGSGLDGGVVEDC